MNTGNHLTPAQALQSAIAFAGIGNEEFFCISDRYAGGLYHFVLRTLCMRYEFYVDAENGEVLGIGTEPLSYAEALELCGGEEVLSPVA